MVIRNTYKFVSAAHTGMHLGGNLDKQKLWSVSNIPYTEQAKNSPKGHAVTPMPEDDSMVYKLILPLYGGEST